MSRPPVHPRRPPAIEALEARLLHSGDPAGAALSDATPWTAEPFDAGSPTVAWAAPAGPAQAAGSPAAATADATRAGATRELAVVDLRIPDIARLLADLDAQRAAGRDIEVITIDGTDGIAALDDALSGARGAYSAVHLFGHGDPGGMRLGSTTLDLAALRTRAGEIAGWSAGLGADADLMLWGCDTGAGEAGRAFVDGLAALTGADVAASDDVTGSLAWGGDWILETTRGAIESAAPIGAALQADYAGRLAVTAVGATNSQQVNTQTTGSQDTPATGGQQLATAANGLTVAVWRDASDGAIYARRYDANGTARAAPERVDDQTGTRGSPAVAIDATGRYVVVWVDETNREVRARLFEADGTSRGPIGSFQVASGGTLEVSSPAVAMNASGRFVVSWTLGQAGDADVRVQRFTANGVSDTLTQTNPVGPGDGARDQDASSVAIRDDGSFAVAYTDSSGGKSQVKVRLYDATGAFTASSLPDDVGASLDENQPSITALATGGYAVAWRIDSGSDTQRGVVAQRIAADGTLGSLLEIDDADSKQARNPSIAGYGNGGFVVAWEDDNKDTVGQDIRARWVGADDTLGTAGTLSTTSADESEPGNQTNASVAIGGGPARVLWSGRSGTDTDGGVVLWSDTLAAIDVAVTGSTDEAGTRTATYTVSLQSAPSSTVTITLSSSNPAEGRLTAARLSTTTLTFTTADWQTPQSVTLYGVDDAIDDGDATWQVTAAAASADPRYAGQSIPVRSVVNADDDVAGLVVSGPATTVTTEAGGAVTFTVALASQPTATVTVNLQSTDTSEGRLSTTTLTFDATNWNAPQTVTVSGVDDTVIDGNRAYQVTATATSTDANYQGRSITPLALTNQDGDTSNLIIVDTTDDVIDTAATTIADLVRDRGTDGRISLREALRAANATANGAAPDRILFALGGTTPTITLDSALHGVLDVTAPVTIDGRSDTLAPGVALVGNGIVDGLRLAAGSDGSVIRGLAIGNAGVGLVVESSGNVIESNRIGTDLSGMAARGNTKDGIVVLGGSGNVIRDNQISANAETGLQIEGSATTGTLVTGNRIGTNATGTAALGNVTNGVIVIRGSTGTWIIDNTVAGNGRAGIGLFEAGTTGNVVGGNRIGLGSDGVTPIANRWGIEIQNGATGNLIGAGSGSTGNRIGASTEAGVLVVGAGTVGNAIVGNMIVGSGTIAIDLAATGQGDGATPNDAGDADTGGNGLQNTPVLDDARPATGTEGSANAIVVTGSLRSAPTTTYRIDVYADSPGAGNAGARWWVGTFEVTTDATGLAQFESVADPAIGANGPAGVLAAPLASGARIVATATRLVTTNVTDTSELSASIPLDTTPTAPNTPPAITNLDTRFVPAGTTDVATLRATDPDAGTTITWTIAPGGNADLFTLVGDQLRFVQPPTLSTGGDGANTYTVTVRAGDGLAEVSRTLTVQVVDATSSLVRASGIATVDGTTAGQRLTTDTGGRAIAALPGGGFVMAWSDASSGVSQVWMQRRDANGDPIAAAVRVDTAGTATQAAVAVDAQGRIAVTWTEGANGAGDVKVRVYDAQGVALSEPRTVNIFTAGHQNAPAIASNPQGGWVMTWTQGNSIGSTQQIVLQRLTSDGASVGSQFVVSQQDFDTQRGHSSVGVAADGAAVVTWASNADGGAGTNGGWGVYVRVIEASNAFRTTDPVRVNASADGEQTEPQVAVAANGSFAVVWTDKPSTASVENDSGIRLRLFDRNANARGSERYLDAAIVGRQDQPTVAFLADGTLVAAWESAGSDGNGTEAIVLRRFAPDGSALSTETVVNPYAPGDQTRPSIAAAGNRIAVAWSGATGSTNDGVAMRTYTTPPPVLAMTARVQGGAGTTLVEAGGTLTFDVVLTGPPSSGTVTVHVGLSAQAAGRAQLSTSTLTFDATNWYVARPVTVTSLADTLVDGSLPLTLSASVGVAADPRFTTLAPVEIALLRTDDDTRNEVTVTTDADTDDANANSLAALFLNPGADGKVSLREAIRAANGTTNAAGGADRIVFALGAGHETIRIGAALPDITDTVEIDGRTQAGYATGQPVVVITPAPVSTAVDGLRLVDGSTATDDRTGSDGSTIRGLVIGGFRGDGLRIESDGNLIESNRLGVGATGQAASGNSGSGLVLSAPAGLEGAIDSNAGASGNRVLDNVIVGNLGSGVVLAGTGTSGNAISGNFIGTDRSGTAELGNSVAGISVRAGAVNNTLGGSGAGDGNRIAFNPRVGIQVQETGGSGPTGISILRNTFIGPAQAILLGGQSTTVPSVRTNDAGDPDTGANGRQNSPVPSISAADSQAGTYTVDTTLDSQAGRYRIDYYRITGATTASQSTTWIGSQTVDLATTGRTTLPAIVLTGLAYGESIAATATRIETVNDVDVARDTSELSGRRIVNLSPEHARQSNDFYALENGTQVFGDRALTQNGTVTAVDEVPTTVRWSFNPNDTANNALFTIDEVTGAIAFRAAPNFEQSSSATPDTDRGVNAYRISVRATDEHGATRNRSYWVNVLDVNEAPVAGGPRTATTAEDTALTFSTAGGNALSAVDPDAGTTAVDVTLVASSGRLTLASTSGLAFVDGTADGSGSLRFGGSADAVASALASVVFRPAPDSNGPVTLTLTATDRADPTLSTTATVAITVTAVDDASVLQTPATFETVVRSEGTQPIGTAQLRATDVDSPAAGVFYQLDQAPTSGSLTLDGVPLAQGARFTQADVNDGRIAFKAPTEAGTPMLVLSVVEPSGSGSGGTTPRVTMRFTVTGMGGSASGSAGSSASAQADAQRRSGAASDAPSTGGDAGSAGSGTSSSAAGAASAAAAPAGPGARAPGAASAAIAPAGVGVAAGVGPVGAVAARSTDTGTAAATQRDPSTAPGGAQTLGADSAVRDADRTVSGVHHGPASAPTDATRRAASAGPYEPSARDWSPVSAMRETEVLQELQEVRQELANQFVVRDAIAASSVALTTSLSIGYVVWVTRGGVLLTSLLASMPAWRSIDPLPVLARVDARGRDDDGEDDSLRGLLQRAADRQADDAVPNGADPVGGGPAPSATRA